MNRIINWFALAAGVCTLLLIGISVFVPWWTVKVGTDVFEINTSPLTTFFRLANEPVNVPLVWALNLASILTMASGGIIMLIYSLVPTKSYGIKLLNFAYKKPIYAVVLFMISLISLIVFAGYAFGFNIPFFGTTIVALPTSLIRGISISAIVTSEFLWPFYFGIATIVLCVIARVYHSKLMKRVQQTGSISIEQKLEN